MRILSDCFPDILYIVQFHKLCVGLTLAVRFVAVSPSASRSYNGPLCVKLAIIVAKSYNICHTHSCCVFRAGCDLDYRPEVCGDEERR